MATYEAECPKCRGNMWDNRATKRNPKQPDFKCKDRDCDGVIWPSKATPRATPAPAANVKGAYSGGPRIPGLDDEPGAELLLPHERLDKLFALYSLCYTQAYETVGKVYGLDGATPVAVTAAAATLFIAAKERGLAA